MTQRGKLICEELKKSGVEYILWLPDSETHFMHDPIRNDCSLRVIQVCAEGEAVAICAGLYMGRKRGVVLIENSGAFDSGNILKWVARLQFPVVVLLGCLGYQNLEVTPEGKKTKAGQRDITEPFLEALRIPYDLVGSDGDVGKISAAFSRAERESRPVALIVTTADGYLPGGG